MPLVDRDAEVTLVVLVYRSLEWLKWCMEGVDSSVNSTRYRWCVVANDATDEVSGDPRITLDWRNDNPDEYYINRVYRAWNEGVIAAPTQWVILMNTDMYASDHAIDELFALKKKDPKALPCGLLVEQGHIPSAMPEHVHDFGTNPVDFKQMEFLKHAKVIRKPYHHEGGRLYQPVLFDRQEFMDIGGYPEGNIGGQSGDKTLFDKYIDAGFEWTTCLGSVFYHCQEGEMRWP